MPKNQIWILTEEYPLARPVKSLISIFCKKFDVNIEFTQEILQILPVYNSDQKYDGTYKVHGAKANNQQIILKVVMGNSSFIDYLFFYQEKEPIKTDVPLMLAEVTKTDDSESRNTGINQRATKMIYAKKFYPSAEYVMYYDISVKQKDKVSPTYTFGARCFATLSNVSLAGRTVPEVYAPFTTPDEIIEAKSLIKAPPKGNIPTGVSKIDDVIHISARLEKNGSIGHDPNIGFVSLVAGALRDSGYKGKIIVDNHGLPASYVLSAKNKFAYISSLLDIELNGFSMPTVNFLTDYWRYELETEKHGSMLLANLFENFNNGKIIYANHGGTERGYLHTPSGVKVVPKYVDKELYKSGDKENGTFRIPDVVIQHENSKTIYLVEAKKYATRNQGIVELTRFDAFESLLKEYYPEYKLVRSLCLSGSGDIKKAKELTDLMFYVDDKGEIALGDKAPIGFKTTI
jgi:hypothetical protein